MMMPPQVMQQQMSSKQQVSATKVTKVRRARQPRNPQLSVARRNERERNRVKMVNNGFALLREHLPVEDLRHCEERPDAASPGAATPDGGKSASAKAKKYSKVETLRAAIQRIKMLEELIRSSDAEFESMNIIPASASSSSPHIALANACNYDDEPLSVCAPLSCDSSNSTTTTTTATMHLDITSMHSTHHLQHPNQISYAGSQQQQQQFIKLEPQQQQQHHYSPQRAASHLPSPTQNSQASSSASVTQYHQPPTQVQHNNLEQQPQSLHTHLWLQQHQSSFIEQQQQQHQYTAPEHIQLSQQQHGTGSSWQYMHEQKAQVESGNWYVQDASPAATGEQQQQQQFQQQPQAESKVWFSSAGDSSPGIATTASPSASSQPFAGSHHHHHHHQHQISLYSQ